LVLIKPFLGQIVFQTDQNQNYRHALGLKRDPFAPEPDAKFYYPFDSFEQRLQVLDHLVQGTDLLVLVVGETGSGKTTLLHRYLVTTDVSWKADLITPSPASVADPASTEEQQHGYPVFVQQDAADPIVIVDDAHKLPQKDLRFLLQKALVPESAHKIKRLVLFGEPSLSRDITSFSESTIADTAINKITMPALTSREGDAYLQYRPALAGYTGESLFKPSVIKMIHKKSAGLPGRMNEHANRWLKKKYGPNSQKEGIFTLLRNLPLKAVGWGVVAIALVVLGLLVFNQMDSTPPTALEKKNASLRVFRAKIPAIVDVDTPTFINRVSPKAEETAPQAAAETKEMPPVAKQPTALAKVPPQRVTQSQVKPPPLKPVTPRKTTAKNTIYRENWLLDQEASFYTLQVLGVRNEESLLNFVKVHKLLLNQNVAYYKTVYKGKQWYPLLYGVYPTKSEAADAVRELPDKVQKSIPWIRKMSAIQKEVQTEAKR
jgi:type II secretory pathway predicted ATPase ExeA